MVGTGTVLMSVLFGTECQVVGFKLCAKAFSRLVFADAELIDRF